MEQFTKEELNVIGLMISNTQITGKDAPFVAALLAKLQRMVQQPMPASSGVEVS